NSQISGGRGPDMAWKLFLAASFVLTATPANLPADTLRGVVTDNDGRPIAGARVDIATAAPKIGYGNFCPSCYLDCRKGTRTDEQGRFEIDDLDPKLKFRVCSTATGKQTRLTDHVDPAQGDVTIVLPDFPEDIPPQRLIEGTVVSHLGAPIP